MSMQHLACIWVSNTSAMPSWYWDWAAGPALLHLGLAWFSHATTSHALGGHLFCQPPPSRCSSHLFTYLCSFLKWIPYVPYLLVYLSAWHSAWHTMCEQQLWKGARKEGREWGKMKNFFCLALRWSRWDHPILTNDKVTRTSLSSDSWVWHCLTM